MKKITDRSFIVLLLSLLVIGGMCLFVVRYVDKGQEWALYFSRSNSGSVGELQDRNGTMLAHFSGYENLFSPDENTRKANYHVTGDYWGRTGTGVLSNFWSDMQGFDLIYGTTQAKSSTLRLNIDSRLNNVIYSQLNRLTVDGAQDEYLTDEEGNEYIKRAERYKGAVLVCNYKTGELLGMVSMPTVDPLDADAQPEDGAYINRCLSAAFTPGSVFKLITAAAAIENIPDIYQKEFYCEKEYEIAGVPITCSGTHYNEDFKTAMANSCNVAFAQIAVMLGQDTLTKYVKDYGFLNSQSLDGINTATGSYPTEFVGDPELAWSGIGQSTDMICPYSMLRLVCAIANEGLLIEPKLLMDGKEPTISRFMPAETAENLKELMANNVESHYSTEVDFGDLKMCAKTGTAELGNGLSHAWFVGFLDDDNYPFAFVTFIEQGGGGLGTAGALTKRFLQQYIKYELN